jgi:hypothetical protein
MADGPGHLCQGARRSGEQGFGRGGQCGLVDVGKAAAEGAAHPGDQHRVVQPAQGQAVTGRHQVQRAAHEQHPHRGPLVEQIREVCGHEVVQPGPDADVGLLRFLRLEPEVLDEVQRGSAVRVSRCWRASRARLRARALSTAPSATGGIMTSQHVHGLAAVPAGA